MKTQEAMAFPQESGGQWRKEANGDLTWLKQCQVCAVTLLDGWQEGNPTCKKCWYHLSSRVLFWNKWRKKTMRKQLTQVH